MELELATIHLPGISDHLRRQCHLIAEHARAVTGAPRAILLLYDETIRRLVTVATPGSEIALQQIAVDLVRRNYPGLDPLALSYRPTINDAVAAAFVGQRTQVNTMEEAFANIMPAPVSAIARGLVGITHVVSTPVVAEGRALGLIRFLVAGPPSAAQQALMEAAASQIGLTLANAELAEQARRQLAATRAMGEVARLSASAGLTVTLDALVGRARDITDADAATVYLVDDDGATFSPAAESLSDQGRAADIGRMATPRREIGTGLVGWVIAAGEAAFVPDVRRDPRTQTRHTAIREGAIAVPMRVGSTVVGCFRISVLGKRRFAEGDLWVAQTLADEAAVALQNAREMERIEARARAEGERVAAARTAREIDAALAELLRCLGTRDLRTEGELRAIVDDARALAQRLETAVQRLSSSDSAREPDGPLPA
ncbi:MAG TPA: GAF domain-containing protein [Chloroflexota bacterium]|nr:GAF domain-containing protein [Chloroflexota bacterium]